MTTYIVKKDLQDAYTINLHVKRISEAMSLAVYGLLDLAERTEKHGYNEYSHSTADKLIEVLFGELDNLDTVCEELIALEEATEKEKKIDAVKTIVTTPPEERHNLDEAVLLRAGLYDTNKSDPQENQIPKDVGDIVIC